MLAFFLLVSLATVCSALNYRGVDVSQPASVSAFQCLKSDGYSFAVVRAYQSSGHVDPNAVQTMMNAHEGGMSHVDAYLFPCPTCGTPSAYQQMEDTVNALKNVEYGMLWLDIEGTQYWHSDQSQNVNFIQGLVDAGNALNVTLGMYTSKSQWSQLCGTSSQFSYLPLWYPHYENPANPTYSDFVSFGGWKSPSIKQYQGTTSLCGAGVDLNAYQWRYLL